MSQATFPYITEAPFSDAYAAGLFDGEGCISLMYVARRAWKSDPSKRVYGFRLVVVLSNTHRGIVELLRDRFSGDTMQDASRDIPAHRKSIYTWRLNASSSQTVFLRRIAPYSIIKSDQIAIALDYLGTTVGPGQRISQSAWDIRKECYERMAALNKRGLGFGHNIAPRTIASKGNTMGRPLANLRHTA